jgi:beta propeller repeat protein
VYLALVVSVLLFATTAPRASVSTVTFSGFETRITTDLGDQYDPSISGNTVVFTDFRGSDADVYHVDLATMDENEVAVAPGNQQLTGVSGQRIVYTDYRTVDVVMFDTGTGTTTNLTRADKEALGRNFNSIDPAISGGLVAWQDSRDGNMEIYAKDVTSGVERRITDAGDIDQRPSVSGATIVWERCVPAGGTCDIWSYDWDTGLTTRITDTPDSNERTPNIDGGRIAYQSDRISDYDICLNDLAVSTETCLALDGDQANPRVSGDNVSFDDASGGLYHVKLWHVPTGQVFAVTSGASGQYLNDIDGNRIVYTDDRNGHLDIYMFTFTLTPESDDTTPPSIALTPSCPATLMLGSSFVVDVAVTDEGSGVATQSVPNGLLALDTSTVGPHALTVEAADHAANAATAGCRYAVVYDFAGAGGFAAPVADQPAVNSAKAGSAVPVKWQLPDGHGGFIGSLSAVTSLTFGEVADFGGAPDTEIEAPTAGASGLRYDAATQQFVFTWKTERSMAGRSFVLVLRLNDGQEYYANFKLK